MKILELQDVKKTYRSRGIETPALKGVNFSVDEGEFIAIMGESGSGKTTLLNLVATLDQPTSGSIILEGQNLAHLKEKDIAAFRRNELGFVFQTFNLLDQFTNRDNIYLPLVLSGVRAEEMKSRLAEIQDQLMIEDFVDKYPYEISGGQKQRIATARAIITKPALLLADEPTGSLDSASADAIMRLFTRINENAQTILMVTHSLRSASYARRVLFIKDGIVFHELYRGEEDQEAFMERIHQAQTVLRKKVLA